MKKLLIVCSLAALIVSCEKDGSVSISGSKVDQLETDGEKAAYAYGLNMSRSIENAKNSPFFKEDSLNNDQLIKGFKDYLSDGSKGKLSYVFGQQLASSVENFMQTQETGEDFKVDIVVQAIIDQLNKDSLLLSIDSTSAIMNTYTKDLLEKKKVKNLEKSNAFLAKEEKNSGVQKTESGLLYQVISKGDGGNNPSDTDIIKANYEGKLMDGTVFDSTAKNNNTPIELSVNQFVPGFSEGLKLMSPGDKYKFIIPPVLAYGENGARRAGIGPNEALIFEVELLEIKKPEPGTPNQGQSVTPQVQPQQLKPQAGN